MSFNKWPKRSAEKNYFMVPNEIFSIGLDFREISLYSYLLRCENRKTYQCYPSYKTIGHAIGMSENTVAKYVRQLEEKGLIYTEPTMVRSKDGRPLNGNLLYTVRPIQGVCWQAEVTSTMAKNQFIRARVAGWEKDCIRRKADAAHMTESEFVRRAAMDREVTVIEGMDELLRELRYQGNNLNQLTVMARQGRITQVNYEPFTEVYRNAWQTLNSLLSHAV